MQKEIKYQRQGKETKRDGKRDTEGREYGRRPRIER